MPANKSDESGNSAKPDRSEQSVPTTPATDPKWASFGRSSGESAVPNAAAFQKLAEQIEAKRSAPTAQVVQWLYDHAGTPIEQLDPDDVPSRGALRHLMSIQASEPAYRDFISTCWKSTIPSRTELERGARFNDDGRKQFDLLDEFERSLNEEEGKETEEV